MTIKTCLPWAFFGLLAFVANVCGAQPQPQTSPADRVEMASCHGPLAQKTWQRWDEAGQAYATQVLHNRLLGQGDTYVLYDLQTLFHNLLAMSERCGNAARLRQMAALVQTAYGRLEPDAPGSIRRHWVCRGGAVCNSGNKLLNTEVMLTSVQFLAFAIHAATALQAQLDLQPQDRAFVQQTALVAAEHLLRWGDARAVQALHASLAATPQDVADGRSRYFLTDKVLWQLAIYARLAGLLQRNPDLVTVLDLSTQQWQQLRTHAQALSALVKRRVTQTTATDNRGRAVQLSDLDVGYWRYHHPYAGYEGTLKPAVCDTAADGTRRAVLQVPPSSVPVRDDIGWDISHARRLVHYFDAINAHRAAFTAVWQEQTQGQPSSAVMQGFAHQLLVRVWNQDADYPLFANYYSGANGWYRVAYDNGTGRCIEGYPPHWLTDSFVTGGYPSWAAWQPQLGQLAWRLYALAESKSPADQAFVARYYRGLTKSASTTVQLLQQLMFWSSLISGD
jgi:hypothetical protein